VWIKIKINKRKYGEEITRKKGKKIKIMSKKNKFNSPDY